MTVLQDTNVCPVCNVSIHANGTVHFSSGAPGTRARLYARVCQYNQKPGCINQDLESIGEISPTDNFESGEALVKSINTTIENLDESSS